MRDCDAADGVHARAIVVALLLISLSACDSGLTYGNRDRFFAEHKAQLEQLEAELRDYGRIRHMSNGLRRYTQLNEELVALEPAGVETPPGAGWRPTLPVETILQRDSISPKRYEELRQLLIDSGFIEAVLTESYTAFLFDGFLDNANGFLRLQPGRDPPELRSELFTMQLVLLLEVAPGWFYFATT